MDRLTFRNNLQKEAFDEALFEIKSVLTGHAEIFVPADILVGYEINTESVPFRVFVSGTDFVPVCEVAERYASSLVPFSVSKTENRTGERGVYFAI